MEMSMEGDPMEMGAEDGEAKMSLRMTSVRQGPGCTSGDCTLTNEVMEVSMYVDSEGPGIKMIMSMYVFATTYSRDMVPYYGDPVAELPGGGSFFLGQSEPEEVEIIRDGDNVMFSPAEIEIEVNTTVIWYNDDDTTHTVTAEDGTFDSGDIDPYSEWEYTFGEVGEYAYYSDKTEDKEPFGNLTGKVIVTEIEPIDLDWDTEAGVGLDSDDDGKDDWIEYYAYAWDDEENMSIAATLTQNIETGTLYPRHLEFHNETGVPIMAFEFWYGDEVYIELNDDEGLNKSATQFNWDADSYDDNETSQNVYEGTISEGNGNYMQEAPNDEMEIRVLEAYEGSDDEGPDIGDPFGGDEEEEGGRENARVVASMVLSDGGDDMVDTETGCHWYITWNDNDGDGLVSVNDTYEIRSDKMGTGGEVCNREGENGNATYVIEFFDLWADAYVDGPNPALAPGFTGLFAAFAIAGLAGLRRRRR
jgi:plastocyanin